MWQKISSANRSSFWTPTQIGDELVGYYINTVENQGPRKNSTIHTFQLEDKTQINVWGSTILDECLKTVTPGTKIKIVYQGKTTIKGGNCLKQWEVFMDKEDNIPIVESSDNEKPRAFYEGVLEGFESSISDENI